MKLPFTLRSGGLHPETIIGKSLLILAGCLWLNLTRADAQTPTDGLMMSQGNLCTVAMYSHEQWSQYWEGTLKRTNANLGNVSTESIRLMGALGISNRLNVMFDAPYVWTKASAGTMRGMQGMQDLSLAIKWQPAGVQVPYGKLAAFAVAGFSTPMSRYVTDFLPMSIGTGSTTGSLKGILHYKTRFGAFITAQAGYTRRSNIRIDRQAYFTDKMVYSNEVFMPDVVDGSVRAGFINRMLTAEVIISRFTALGGFDITRNNMPFPSNLMQATRVGFNGVYRPAFSEHFSVNIGASYATHGRNVGQSTAFYGGLQYVMNLWGHSSCRINPEPATSTNAQPASDQ